LCSIGTGASIVFDEGPAELTHAPDGRRLLLDVGGMAIAGSADIPALAERGLIGGQPSPFVQR